MAVGGLATRELAVLNLWEEELERGILVGRRLGCRWRAMKGMLMLKARRRHGNRVLEFRAWHQSFACRFTVYSE